MQRLGLPAILDRPLLRYGSQQGLDWGWIATILAGAYFVAGQSPQTSGAGLVASSPRDDPRREIVTVRYQIAAVSRQAEAFAAQQETMGWRAHVANAPSRN